MNITKPPKSARVPADKFLAAVPHVNQAMEIDRRRNGTAIVSVPMRRPRYLVPPLSWIIPFSSHRRVELDKVGVSVLDLCNGHRNVESIIDKFATDHKLSFREAQLAITQFTRQLVQRGLVAVVGMEGDTES